MSEVTRHSRPSAESPRTIVREKQAIRLGDDGPEVVTYATIERYVPAEHGAYEHRQTGGGVISAD